MQRQVANWTLDGPFSIPSGTGLDVLIRHSPAGASVLQGQCDPSLSFAVGSDLGQEPLLKKVQGSRHSIAS